MLKRIIESHQNEVFTGIQNAQKYAEESEKSSKMRFRGFLKKIDKLNIKGNYLEVSAGSGTLAAMIAKRNKDIEITAVEISSDMITVANELLKMKSLESQINFVEGNIEDDRLSDQLGKYDLKRVWWLYWIKKQTGFYKSIRASYQPNEIRKMLNTIGVKKYEINNIFPYFLQNIVIWK